MHNHRPHLRVVSATLLIASTSSPAKLPPAVTGILDDNEATAVPPAGQLPRGVERTGDVIPAVNKNRRYARQPVHAVEQLVLTEKVVIAPVMCDQARKHHPERRILIAGG